MADQELFELARQFKELRRQKKEKEQELKAIKEQMAEIEKELVTDMTDMELQNFKLDGSTFYLRTDMHVNDVADSREQLCEVLRNEGYGDLVKEQVPHQTLKAFVKELVAQEGEVPKWLEPYIRVHEQERVGVLNS